MVPSYYLNYFYNHDAEVAAARGTQSRGARVAEMEAQLLEMYADPSVDTKPALLGERGGAFYSEAAINLLASLTADRGDVQVVNLRNDGTLPFLPDDAVVEVPATITAAGATALPVDPVPPIYSGLIAHTFAYEQLALDAAVHGGRDRVFEALLAHPLVGQVDQAEKLTDLLLAANRDAPELGAVTPGTADSPLVLAIDGGNSKTEVLLTTAGGEVAHVGARPRLLAPPPRGPGRRRPPRRPGPEGRRAGRAERRDAGRRTGRGLPRRRRLPEREGDRHRGRAGRRGWARQLEVDNDSFALLRAGTDVPDAVAVVCGAGINCVGVARDGRHARFASLGRISGDWGGGMELGDEALWWAARADDGRGPATALTSLVPSFFGLPDVPAVYEAIHFGRLDHRRLIELAPLVLTRLARGRPRRAAASSRRLADEVVAFARAAMTRLDMLAVPTVVVLGGGVLDQLGPGAAR